MANYGTNAYVMEKFIARENASSSNGNVYSRNNSFYSYAMEIARWIDDVVYVMNPPETSVTTRKHISQLWTPLRLAGVKIKTVSGHPSSRWYSSGGGRLQYYLIDNITWSDNEIMKEEEKAKSNLLIIRETYIKYLKTPIHDTSEEIERHFAAMKHIIRISAELRQIGRAHV